MATTRFTGLYAMVAAVAAVALAPLLALSYFAIGEGAEELEHRDGRRMGASRPATSRAAC